MIQFEVLGEIGWDNCVSVQIATGQSTDQILLDCGGNCLSAIPDTSIRDLTAIFFSHFHFDHFAGFDEVIRNTWCREGSYLDIFGPPGTLKVIHHRLRGYLWNNAPGLPGGYRISEFDGKELRSIRLLTTEQFETVHEEPTVKTSRLIYQGKSFSVSACVLDHGVESIGYLIRESDKFSICKQRMEKLNINAGEWAGKLNDNRFFRP